MFAINVLKLKLQLSRTFLEVFEKLTRACYILIALETMLLPILIVIVVVKWETYTRHLNHKTNCKCPKALQEITNQYWVTKNAFFTVTQLDVQKVYKMMKFCPRWITDSTVSKTCFARLCMSSDACIYTYIIITHICLLMAVINLLLHRKLIRRKIKTALYTIIFHCLLKVVLNKNVQNNTFLSTILTPLCTDSKTFGDRIALI